MTRRSMGSMAAALMAAAGLSNVAWSDNTGQPVPAGPNSGATAGVGGAGAKQPGLAPAGSESGWNWRAEAFGGYKSDTKPSRDSIMQFSASSEVREILTPGGSRVKKGDVLIRARDTEIIAALTQQRIRAGNELEIKGAEEQAKLADAKLKALQKSTVFSEVEYWEAETAARVSVIQLDLAKWNKQQEELRVKQLEAQAERFRLEAPFDGIVEEVMVEVGQGVTEQDKVLRLVNVEKIWLDPYADTNETIRLGLKEGSPAWVLLDLPEPKMARGRVVYVSPVAESVSQTRRVRVEIENPMGWPAGTQARVRFTEPGGEWEKYKAQATSTGLFDGTEPLASTGGEAVFGEVAVGVNRAQFRLAAMEKIMSCSWCTGIDFEQVLMLNSPVSRDFPAVSLSLRDVTQSPTSTTFTRAQTLYSVPNQTELPFWALFLDRREDYSYAFVRPEEYSR